MESKISKLGKKTKISKVKASSGKADVIDIIPLEVLLIISLNGNIVSVVSCSPIDLNELVVGYLINNDYIKSYSDIKLLKIYNHGADGIADGKRVALKVEVSTAASENKKGHLDELKFTLLGYSDFDNFISKRGLKKTKSNLKIASDIILGLNMKTMGNQRYKKEFGGLHSAALFDKNGNLLNIAEDIGRRNCIDKIAGYILIKNLPPKDKIVFTTGRLDVDLIYKACKMQVPIIATNSSVTFSAVAFAKKMNLTVIGYARGGRFNIYSSPQRILQA